MSNHMPILVEDRNTFEQWRLATNQIVKRLNLLYNADNILRIQGSAIFRDDISVGRNLNVTGFANISKNLTVDGDLVIKGTTTTVNSEIVTMGDKIITLNWSEDNPNYYDSKLISGLEVNLGTDDSNLFATGLTTIQEFLYNTDKNETTFQLQDKLTKTIPASTDPDGNVIPEIQQDVIWPTDYSGEKTIVFQQGEIKHNFVIKQILEPTEGLSNPVVTVEGNAAFISESTNDPISFEIYNSKRQLYWNEESAKWVLKGAIQVQGDIEAEDGFFERINIGVENKLDSDDFLSIVVEDTVTSDPLLVKTSEVDKVGGFLWTVDKNASDIITDKRLRLELTDGTSDIETNILLDPTNNSYIMKKLGIGKRTPEVSLDVIGNVKASARFGSGSGTVGNPAYHFNSDSDTGMYLISTGKLSLATGGSDRITIDSDGKVGIGTTSPVGSLEVMTDGDTTEDGIILRSSSAGGRTLRLWATGDKAHIGAGDGTQDLILNHAGGNVGIGTTAPSVKLDIEVNDNTPYSESSSNPVLQIGNINTSANTNFSSLQLFTDGDGRGLVNLNALSNSTSSSADFSIQTRHNATIAERIRITSDGNVGIGTTTPNAKLSIGIGGTAALPAFILGNDQDTGLYRPADNSLGFTTSGVSRMVIKDDGNVGIGTTSPDELLHLEKLTDGVNEGNPGIVLENSDQKWTIFNRGSSSDRFQINDMTDPNATTAPFRIFPGAPTDSIHISSNGNVGIGTSNPSEKLHVDGAIALSSQSSSTPPPHQFYASGTILLAGTTIWGHNGTQWISLFSGQAFDPTNAIDYSTNNWLRVNREDTYGIADNNGDPIPDAAGTDIFATQTWWDVGVGIEDPVTKLHVVQDTPITGESWSNNPQFVNFVSTRYTGTIENKNTTGNGLQIRCNTTDSNVNIFRCVNDSPTYDPLANPIDDSGTDQFVVKGDGNVGIGTSSPNAKLEVVSNGSGIYSGAFTNNHDNGSGVLINAGTSSSNFPLRVRNKSSNDLLAVTATGNVGIGTTDPKQSLEIDGVIKIGYISDDGANSDLAGCIRWNATRGLLEGHDGTLNWTDANGDSTGWFAIGKPDWERNDTTESIFYKVNDINKDGYVGIGTNSPQRILDVEDSRNQYAARIKNTHTTGSGLQVVCSETTSSDSYIFACEKKSTTSPQYPFVVKGDGNVGIGTTTPSSPLHIKSATDQILKLQTTDQVTNGPLYMGFYNNGDGQKGWFGYGSGGNEDISIWNKESGSVKFATSDEVRMTIDSSGKVGIGILPSYQLHVRKDQNAKTNIALQNHDTGTSADSEIFIETKPGGGDPFVHFQIDGTESYMIGIDNSDSDKFKISDGYFGTSDRLVIDSSGKVGIGTADPDEDLHIDGNLKLTVGGRQVLRVRDMGGSNNENQFDIGTYDTANSIYESCRLKIYNRGDSRQDPHIRLYSKSESYNSPHGTAISFVLDYDVSGSITKSVYSMGNLENDFMISTLTGSNGLDESNAGSRNTFFRHDYSQNSLHIGNASCPTLIWAGLTVYGQIQATGDIESLSDISVKENLEIIENPIEKIKELNGYTFNKNGEEKRSAGLIAQEVEKVLPEVVSENSDGIKSLAYGNIVALLVETVKEQQKQIDELKQQISNK